MAESWTRPIDPRERTELLGTGMLGESRFGSALSAETSPPARTLKQVDEATQEFVGRLHIIGDRLDMLADFLAGTRRDGEAGIIEKSPAPQSANIRPYAEIRQDTLNALNYEAWRLENMLDRIQKALS